ncbi:multidrug efflux SMR transporter [Nocardia puris]|uniref:Small multidrug resistance pump n=1 Tax=Nocardia puris TaxID=208602 RepID=A0A366E224_9NOCA|nr:multidrug efflux SMR transporter [Nocardia puris]MBF6212812.1 multidrug efflux SMR transporter [Nocardia puris]MBF6367747.1 multidrug efflux SMR transporter [Nocardia puris]MBF6461398.1 multidrug efflux SMR transporter [Nocardia puris]RBO96362.1 small multidrug resistance pump [Nocardia puris]
MTLLIFLAAVVAEVTATVSLKLSDGFSKLWPTLLVGAGYLTAFGLLALLLQRGLEVGVVYAAWSAVGLAAVAAIGVLFLGESLSPAKVFGLTLIVVGVVTLQLAGVH